MKAHAQDRPLRKPLLAVAAATLLLLLIPVVAMQVTAEVRWGIEDFLAAAFLLFGTGVGLVLIARHVKRTTHRAALMGILVLALLLVWAELAVGIFS